ncbi:MAG: ATP-NAD kinase [Haloferacaceae archaeon]
MDAETPARVAVRGSETEAVRGAVTDAGASVVERDPDAVVVAGEAALCSLATDLPNVPVVPVTERDGLLAVAPEDLSAALSGPFRRQPHPVLGVRVDGDATGRALVDVTLVTRESANISEFAVRAGGRRVGDFRADGAVVATPLGSAGYARAAGGPVVGGGGGLAVVPVAQFATSRGAWVLDPPVDCVVERDEEPVSLVRDGTVVGDVGVGRPVRVEAVDSLDLLVPVDGVESF